jgi:hypothetical protein
MRNIWAVARVTVREALRQKAAIALLLLLGVLLPTLGLSIKGDATLPGRAQMFLDWSLRSSRLILGFLTVFVACGTLAWELKYRQAYITLVKPLPRWQFLVGKWVGVGLLNLGLLACVGAVIEGFTWNFRGRPGLTFAGGHLRWKDEAVPLVGLTEQQRNNEQREREILLREVLVARVSLKPVPPMKEIMDEIDRIIEQRKDEGRMPAGQGVREFREELLAGKLRDYATVAPLSDRAFKFRGLSTAKRSSGFIQIRYCIEPGQSTPNDMMSYAWQIGVPRKTEVRQYDRLNESVRTVHTLRVPASLISDDGELEVRFINVNPDNPEGTFPASAIFAGDKGLEVLYPVDDFESNLVRALAMIELQMLFLAALGLCAASFLTFPTACLLCLLVFFAGSGVSYLLESISWTMRDDTAVLAHGVTKVTRPLVVLFLNVIPDFSAYSPSEALVDGKVVAWNWNIDPSLGRALVYMGVLRTGLVVLAGCLILQRREVAQVIV